MRKIAFVLALSLSTLAAVACKDDTAAGAASTSTVATADGVKEEKKETPKEGLVTLDPNGSEFNPPVSPDRIPSGAWYCDMGTVHYARPDKGDGKCPLCHMNLKEKK